LEEDNLDMPHSPPYYFILRGWEHDSVQGFKGLRNLPGKGILDPT
jgi:hypothetical protein